MKLTKLVCLGDSITFGYDITPDKRWTRLLSEEMGIEVINAGINGDTTAGMLGRFQEHVLKHAPTHVLITGGTNDLWFGLKDEVILANLYSMVKQAQYANVQPIIGMITPCFNLNESNLLDEDYSECIRSFRNNLRSFCDERGIDTIDLAREFTRDHIMADGLHPNRKGQYKLATTIADGLSNRH